MFLQFLLEKVCNFRNKFNPKKSYFKIHSKARKMVDDIDDLLDEVESKFCRESPSKGKAPINSKSFRCKTKTRINR